MRFAGLTVLLLEMALSGSALAQQIAVSGTVTATDGAVLPGVAIHVVATGIRAITGADGKYSLAAGSDDVLGFSIAGRRPLQLRVLGRTTVDVTMELDRRGWWGVIPSGRPIRIMAAGQTYEGRFARLSEERIVVDLPSSSESIAIKVIDTLWEQRSATGRGAQIGAIATAASLAAFTLFWSKHRCPDCSRSEIISVVAAGASAGTLLGAFAGAWIGRRYTTWVRAYP